MQPTRYSPATRTSPSNSVIGSGVPLDRLAELEAELGTGSPAADADNQQLFVAPQLATYSLLFNTKSSPFDDARLRRAVNFALDRRALASEPYPDATGIPTDQHIPPGMAGYRDTAIYPLGGPDLERARQLAGETDERVTLYTCNLPACAQLAQIIRENLAAIGLRVDIRQFAFAALLQPDRASRRAVRPRRLWVLRRLRRPLRFHQRLLRPRGLEHQLVR